MSSVTVRFAATKLHVAVVASFESLYAKDVKSVPSGQEPPPDVIAQLRFVARAIKAQATELDEACDAAIGPDPTAFWGVDEEGWHAARRLE